MQPYWLPVARHLGVATAGEPRHAARPTEGRLAAPAPGGSGGAPAAAASPSSAAHAWRHTPAAARPALS